MLLALGQVPVRPGRDDLVLRPDVRREIADQPPQNRSLDAEPFALVEPMVLGDLVPETAICPRLSCRHLNVRAKSVILDTALRPGEMPRNEGIASRSKEGFDPKGAVLSRMGGCS